MLLGFCGGGIGAHASTSRLGAAQALANSLPEGEARLQLPGSSPPRSESRDSMLDAIWGSDDRVDTNNGRPEPSTAIASHMTLELDEDGEPIKKKKVYLIFFS